MAKKKVYTLNRNWLTIPENGGGGGGYEPDKNTIIINKGGFLEVNDYISYNDTVHLLSELEDTLKVWVQDNYCLESFAVELDGRLEDVEENYVGITGDQSITGHKTFNGNVQVNYSDSQTHYGANTIQRVVGGTTYTYTYPNRNGTWATEDYVDSKVQAKYIHRVSIDGLSPKAPFDDTSVMTLVFVNKTANEINSWQSIVANRDYLIDGQIYDEDTNDYAKLNMGNIGSTFIQFINLGTTKSELDYTSGDFDNAEFSDTVKQF